MVNVQLMHNHQLELATALARLGHVQMLVAGPGLPGELVATLENGIGREKEGDDARGMGMGMGKAFPEQDVTLLPRLLDAELGF